MPGIRYLIENFKNIKIEEVVQEAFEATVKDATFMQRGQMLAGKNSYGNKFLIGKYKSESYARRKHNMNQLAGFGNVDLRLTGDFQDDIFVDVRENSVVFTSGDPKTGKLVEMYGEQIFGLGGTFKEIYCQEYLGPAGIVIIRAKAFK